MGRKRSGSPRLKNPDWINDSTVSSSRLRPTYAFGSYPERRRLVRPQAEQEEVLLAHRVAQLDVGAVERAQRERAVQRQLHVAGAGRLLARGRDLQREVGGGNDRLRERDAVVRQERDRKAP